MCVCLINSQRSTCKTHRFNVFPFCEPGARLKSPALATNCPHTTSKWLEFKDHCYAFNMTIYNSSVYNMADATSVCVGLGENVRLNLVCVYISIVCTLHSGWPMLLLTVQLFTGHLFCQASYGELF